MDTTLQTAAPFTIEQAPSKNSRARRTFSMPFKRQMVEETLSGDESVSIVARRYDVNANQLFKWRRLYHQGLLGDEGSSSPRLIPITLDTDNSNPTVAASVQNKPATQDCIEIAFPHDIRVLIRGSVSKEALCTVLQELCS